MNKPLNMVDVIRAGAEKTCTPCLLLPNDRTEAEVRAARAKFRLIDGETGKEIVLPAKRTCSDGGEIEIVNFKPVKYQSSGGYIYTDKNEVYVPSVCGAKIIEFPLTEADANFAGSRL
jgi:hypothetical protein